MGRDLPVTVHLSFVPPNVSGGGKLPFPTLGNRQLNRDNSDRFHHPRRRRRDAPLLEVGPRTTG